MRRWGIALGIMGTLLLAWLLWPNPVVVAPEAAVVETVPERAVAQRKQVAIVPPEEPAPELEAAASGELGIVILNRICALCQNGGLEDEACDSCPSKPGPYGRISLDVVDEDGRPFDPHEAGIRASCANRGVIGSGALDLPVGRCTLTAHRVDGLLTVVGDAVEVEITENGEAYASITVSSEPWGAAGMDLTRGEEGGVVVRRLIEGTVIGEAVPVGAEILDVDGADVTELSHQQVARELNGPVGSTVEVRFRDPVTGEEHVVEIERSRLDNRKVAPNMVPG